jgi:hypothetical protein
MKTKFMALLAATAVSLMGCSLDQLNFLPTAKIRAQIPAITYNATFNTTTGILGTENISQDMFFQAQSGSMSARIDGFEAAFEDQAGQPVGVTPKRQTLNSQVGPGQKCDEKTGACVFAVGTPTTVSVDFLTQNATTVMAEEWLKTGTAPSWRAKITFFGTNSNGVSFQWQELQTITCKCDVVTK